MEKMLDEKDTGYWIRRMPDGKMPEGKRNGRFFTLVRSDTVIDGLG
ncbi:MAG: hypothetical protein AB7S72_10660 [Draconibacterium sp.]